TQMDVLVVGSRQVAELLPIPECIEVMDSALRALARDEAVLPLRTITWLPDRRGALGLMPGALTSPAALGVKVVSVFPGNVRTEYESHQGGV
ncbi:MAG: ornithine cyclodeaminase family protein, partial [Gammaproteobacteria bacterium]|nr:ornithine cyclodeaminase family protein [Gammaproteobacteria bacterium]NIV52656.1 ornithine cyclodeaminase family protein [Gammaproteobacteria bacterium]NIX86783.1 ornithine cyclodeaminase family protein [Gammaproteobacteria bacterium]